MFLFPSIAIGLLLALALGGRPSRLLEVEIRLAWAAPAALTIQLVIFSGRITVPAPASAALHLASYALLVVFTLANRRLLLLLPVLLGMLLNGVAIAANGGVMPVSRSAARAAGLTIEGASNVSLGARHARFLGDMFALPAHVPLANVFSVGDLLIGVGMVVFIVAVSLRQSRAPVVGVARLAAPFRSPSFTRLACGRFVTQAGDWLTLTAVVGWMFQRTHSTTDVAVVLLIRLAPPIVGGAVAALVVDRLPKRPLLVGVELARGVAILSAFAAVATGRTIEMLVALGISGVLGAISSPTVPALVPRLLPDELYGPGNAVMGVVDNAAAALGALSGGVTVALVGIRTALAVDVLTFALAAALFLGVIVPPGAIERAARATGRLAGLRYVFTRPRVLVVVLAFGAATLATGLVNATLPRLLAEQTRVGDGAYGYGLAAITVGLALGSAAAGALQLGPGARRWIGAGLVVMASLLAALALDGDAPTMFLVLAGVGIVDGTTDVVFETVVQREVEGHVLGSVFGFAVVFVRTTMVVSVAAAPLVNRLLAPGHAVLAAAALLAAVGLIALAALARSREEDVPERGAVGLPNQAASAT
ncbi:MAG TPA: MFS transporter [Gaiellaceae bacterium]|nr:MFS transporter [Gaiellaceae bacterium]